MVVVDVPMVELLHLAMDHAINVKIEVVTIEMEWLNASPTIVKTTARKMKNVFLIILPKHTTVNLMFHTNARRRTVMATVIKVSLQCFISG